MDNDQSNRRPTDDEVANIKLRGNIGPACPCCGMPCIQRGKPHGRAAYYFCKGYTDPETGLRFPGCDHSFKRRQWRPEDVVEAFDRGEEDQVRQAAQQQIDDRQTSAEAIASRQMFVIDGWGLKPNVVEALKSGGLLTVQAIREFDGENQLESISGIGQSTAGLIRSRCDMADPAAN